MDTNKLKLQSLVAAALLLCAAVSARAAAVTFTESGMSGAAPTAAFSVVGGQVRITMSSTAGVLAPSASLTGVSWTMTAAPVLAVDQATAPAASFSAAMQQQTAGQFGFKAGVSVDPNLYKSFASYSAKGIAGAGMAPTSTADKSPQALSVTALSASAAAHPMMLTLPTSYVVLGTAQGALKFGAPPVDAPLATVLQEAGAIRPGVVVAVPLPSALWMGLSTMLGLGLAKVRRRRIRPT